MAQDKQEKRKIIINEIEHWRHSKLLPEQYCDFLLNLYMEHPDERPSSTSSSFSAASLSSLHWKSWFLGFVIFALICFVVLHFNGFHPALQILTTLIWVGACYVIGASVRPRNQMLSQMVLGVGSLSMLGIGLILLKLHDLDNGTGVASLVAFCSVIWLFTGIFMRVGLLHFCGWIGLALLYGAFLTRAVPHINGGLVQLFWLPVSFLFIWLSWFVHHKNRTGSSVLFLVGGLLWFMPEIHQMLFYHVELGVVQLALFGKIALAALLLFSLRKKWIVWVA